MLLVPLLALEPCDAGRWRSGEAAGRTEVDHAVDA